MRIFPSLLVFAALAVFASAQEQERKLADRISKPNKDLTFDLRQGSTGAKSFGSEKARTKGFGFLKIFQGREFNAKSYRSKEFAGSKSAWMGDMRYSTKETNPRGKYEIPNVNKRTGDKTMAVKDAYDSDKEMAVSRYARGDRPYLGREADKVHKGIDPRNPPAGWGGDLQAMSIDDIRELLNKNE